MQIYLTVNKINGKMYIGKDTKSRKKYLGSGLLLKKAIEKYGSDSFEKVIIMDNIICPIELAREEARFITIFKADTSSNFYNISSGTKSIGVERMREIFQFSNDGIFIKKFDSLESACDQYKGSKGNLCSAASGKRNTWKGYRWSYSETPNDIIYTNPGRNRGTKNSYKMERNHCNIRNVQVICYINQYIISGRIYKKKYIFKKGSVVKKTIYKNKN